MKVVSMVCLFLAAGAANAGELPSALENTEHHKQAEMVVRLTCLKDGSKHFEIISSSGWGGVRKLAGYSAAGDFPR